MPDDVKVNEVGAREGELFYRGRTLTPDPVGGTLHDVADRLNIERPVIVHLEPGDGTRYDLVLAPILLEEGGIEIVSHLCVTRTVDGPDGGFRAGAVLVHCDAADPDYWLGEIRRLADGHAWTEQLFDWWFRKLWAAIDA
jgi:hypothetical protein